VHSVFIMGESLPSRYSKCESRRDHNRSFVTEAR